MHRRKRSIALAAVAAAVAVCSSSRADITFNLNAPAGMDPQAIAGFQQAAARWSANFTDNIAVNIDIGFSDLGTTVLGQTSSTHYLSGNSNPSYRNVLLGLKGKVVSADDQSSYSWLQAKDKSVQLSSDRMLINYTADNPNGAGSATPYLDNSGSTNNKQIYITNANAKTLGLLSANSASDASISFNSTFSFDFDPSNGISAGKIDFVGVATHEIGHALGFESGVDILDHNSPDSNGNFYNDYQFTYVTPLDLFRYSTASIAFNTNSGGVTEGVEDWTAGTSDKYFSVDGGNTKIASFATGEVHGDGQQTSHWKAGQGTGIMNPTVSTGTLLSISQTDRRAFDVIGYTRNMTWKWTDTTSSATATWTNAARWSADGVPDGTITALFNNGAASGYSLTIPSAATAAAMTVGNDNVTLQLAGGSLNAGAVNLGQSSGNAATLKLQRLSGTGSFSTGTVSIGAVAGSTGNLTVQSAAPLTITGDLAIGGTSAASGGTGTFLNSGNVTVSGNLKLWSTANTAATMSGGTLAIAGASTVGAATRLAITGGTFTTPSIRIDGTYSQTAGSATLGAVTLSSTGSMTATQIFATSVNLSATATTLASSGTCKITSLAIAPTGKLDLANNSLIVDYTGTSPATNIRQMLQSGRGPGNWAGTTGIVSSTAQADVSLHHTLGYAEASQVGVTSLGGQQVDGSAIIIRYTYAGDDNLDGIVDLDNDFSLFVDGYNRQVSNPGSLNAGNLWLYGDYNYDGVIDLDNDFSIFVDGYNYYGTQAAQLGQMISTDSGLSLSQRAAMLSVVPEPGSAAMVIGVGSAVALRSRRRREERK